MLFNSFEMQIGVDHTQPTTQLIDLPEEIFRGVLKLLDADSLSRVASCVCRVWRDASREVMQSRLSPRLLVSTIWITKLTARKEHKLNATANVLVIKC